jgi:G6PDH family F420-dependent oxidoreductase
MTKFGYALSSEEHGPLNLVEYARLAEEAGFDFVMVSDHFHPWIDRQGHSPFVWSVLGGIAAKTDRIEVGTGVTCPIIRIHPAIIAHAAATAAEMLPGRFMLGLGTGENLNEHVLGDKWPTAATRRGMLEEAVEIIRALWAGDDVEYAGEFYDVENARLFTRPKQPPPIAIAASGEQAAELAGRLGDAFVGTSPEPESLRAFERAGGTSKPRYGQATLCWGRDEKAARRTAFDLWPTSGLKGELTVELPTPAHFEQAVATLREEDVVKDIACGPDPEVHLDAVRTYVDAGYDHVYVHQVGPEQAQFLDFAGQELLPRLRRAKAA